MKTFTDFVDASLNDFRPQTFANRWSRDICLRVDRGHVKGG